MAFPNQQSFNSVYVLLPGVTRRAWQCGGLLIAKKLALLLKQHISTQIVTYIDREKEIPFLDEILPDTDPADVFIVTWGPHISNLSRRLDGRRIVYYAQSTGWQIRLPVSIPIICLSRYIMAQWMLYAPCNPLFLLGPVLEPECFNCGMERDIDVLFLERKSTRYLRDYLIPELSKRCNVYKLREFVSRQELFRLYNRSQVYVYSSAPWASGWVEGFGFQPLEALVCGCIVFSNLHGGLADYLEPEMNAFKLEIHSLEYDMDRILRMVKSPSANLQPQIEDLRDTYSEKAFHKRIQKIIPALDQYFAHIETYPSNISQLSAQPHMPTWRKWLNRTGKNLKQKLRFHLPLLS